MKIGDCVRRGIFCLRFIFFGSIGAKGQLWVEDFTAEAKYPGLSSHPSGLNIIKAGETLYMTKKIVIE